MSREWLYGTLTAHTPLTDLVGDRIYLSTSITEVPGVKPFIMYRFGTTAAGISGDDDRIAHIQPIQMFVHDIPGDYQRIDSILRIIRDLLDNTHDSGNLIRCQWLEDSEDLLDDEMRTITRFGRYQAMTK